MEDTWETILQDETIFKNFREGTYQPNPEHRQGHPYQEWDELVTSTNTVLLENPEGLAKLITKLDSEKQKKAINLVNLSYITVQGSVPREEKFGKFHGNILIQKEIFDTAIQNTKTL